MDNAAETLVIILSITLAVFLVLAIVAAIKLIQILNHLKHISEKAEKIADTAESVGEFFKYTAGPAALGKFLSNISEAVFNKRGKSKGE